jgi:hypothetical protein
MAVSSAARGTESGRRFCRVDFEKVRSPAIAGLRLIDAALMGCELDDKKVIVCGHHPAVLGAPPQSAYDFCLLQFDNLVKMVS